MAEAYGQARIGRSLPELAPRRWIRWVLTIGVVVGLAGIWLSLGYRPTFYGERLRQSDQRDSESRRFLGQVARLVSDIQNGPRWEGRFDEPIVNAWLAVDFMHNHAERALPRSVRQPCVVMEDDRLRVGFGVVAGPLATVVQVRVQAWVPKPNVLAVEVHDVRAGALPLPASVARVMIERIADAYRLDLTWKRRGRALVALMGFPQGHRGAILERVELRNGLVRLAGSNRRFLPEAGF